MNPTYVAARAKVTEKIRQYGGELQVLRVGPVDDVTGEGGVETVVGTGKALQTEYSTYNIDGDKARVGDKRLLVEADVEILDTDKVEFSGKTWSVVRIEDLDLDGQTRIFAKVQVRG